MIFRLSSSLHLVQLELNVSVQLWTNWNSVQLSDQSTWNLFQMSVKMKLKFSWNLIKTRSKSLCYNWTSHGQWILSGLTSGLTETNNTISDCQIRMSRWKSRCHSRWSRRNRFIWTIFTLNRLSRYPVYPDWIYWMSIRTTRLSKASSVQIKIRAAVNPNKLQSVYMTLQDKIQYLSAFSFSVMFTPLAARTEKSTIWQLLFFYY